MLFRSILVVDDEEPICEILKYNLETEGYTVNTALSVDEALTYDLPSFSLIILDIMMDKISGFDFAKRLKHSTDTENIPILFCSALNGEDERIMGLNIGADDYVVKPFVIRELLARVKSILRRAGITKLLETKINEGSYKADLIFRDIRIERNSRIVYVEGVDIGLTKKESIFLLFLVSHPNIIHSRKTIMEKVWQKGFSSFRTIETTITRLKKKLGICGNCITTRLGYGYGFKEEV